MTATVHYQGADPERLLLAAVLVRALRDLSLYSRGKTSAEQQIATNALDWIFEPSLDDSNLTSFRGICLALDLDFQQVREKIRETMPQEAVALYHNSQPPGDWRAPEC